MTVTKQAALSAEREAYVERVRAVIAQAHEAAAEAGEAYSFKHPHMVDGRLTDLCGGAHVVIHSPSRKFLNALKACGEVSGDGRRGWHISNFTRNVHSQSVRANEAACRAACAVLREAFPEEPDFYSPTYDS